MSTDPSLSPGASLSTEPRAIPCGRRAVGRVRVPPSKSLTHRFLDLALLARRPIVIERPLQAEDTALFLAALDRMGWSVEEDAERREVALRPPLPASPASPASPAPTSPSAPSATSGASADATVEILCGNAGTMLRFLVASLAVLPGHWRLDGVARLRERPVGPLIAALRGLGVDLHERARPGCVPLEIVGGSLTGGATRLDAGESSQYLSALLLAGLAAPRPLAIEVVSLTSAPYVEVTLAAARRFGGRLEIEPPAAGAAATIYRSYPGLLPPPRVRVEGDASAACYAASAAALTGGHVVLEGLAADSAQGDRRFLDLLAAMGAAVTWHGDEVEVRGTGGLRAVTADLSAMPDQVPTLAALAPFAHGTTSIRNVAHLRLKESDRLAAMATELRRLGAPVEEGADRLDIAGTWAAAPPPAGRVEVDSHVDHRIAMSLALVGLRRPGVMIGAPQVVAKSYPAFWRDFLRLLE